MTGSTLDPLAQNVRRDDYVSMAAFARALLETGKSQDDVLRACYGVPFPDEALVIAELIAEDREPRGRYTNRPWKLLISIERGGPPAEPAAFIDEEERRVFVLDAALVPLMMLRSDYYDYGGSMLCYRLDELDAGRSTVFGLQRDLKDGSVAKPCGESLGAALLASAAARVTRLEAEYASPYNRGAGSVDEPEVNGARAGLERVEELIRRTAERKRPKLVP